MPKHDPKFTRSTTQPYYEDVQHGHPVFVRRKDGAISCAYKTEYCDCSKKKKWFNNENKFYFQHGLEC